MGFLYVKDKRKATKTEENEVKLGQRERIIACEQLDESDDQ